MIDIAGVFFCLLCPSFEAPFPATTGGGGSGRHTGARIPEQEKLNFVNILVQLFICSDSVLPVLPQYLRVCFHIQYSNTKFRILWTNVRDSCSLPITPISERTCLLLRTTNSLLALSVFTDSSPAFLLSSCCKNAPNHHRNARTCPENATRRYKNGYVSVIAA